MCECVRLTALDADEQQFAAENYNALEWCIRIQRIEEDFQDVAYIGYLHAVKKWFARPELHRWSFRTVANNTIRSHLSNEMRKQGRRIQTISLETVIPGTNGLTYGDTVTYKHMDYLYKKEIRTLEIKYDIKIPETARMSRLPCVEIEALVEFLSSTHKTMCLSYETAQQASNKASNIRGWVKKNDKKDVAVYKSGTEIYVEKLAIKKGAKRGQP